ncbi:hypothetical protein [Paraburkholderia atlantica]|uniref:hypothetical protein n=1 Tax=Paraburkholderia atlantica TaxID=2654982 RepID=UPI0012FF3359|nr:hypothetical protein [Paraburkholderia atlantica]
MIIVRLLLNGFCDSNNLRAEKKNVLKLKNISHQMTSYDGQSASLHRGMCILVASLAVGHLPYSAWLCLSHASLQRSMVITDAAESRQINNL